MPALKIPVGSDGVRTSENLRNADETCKIVGKGIGLNWNVINLLNGREFTRKFFQVHLTTVSSLGSYYIIFLIHLNAVSLLQNCFELA